MAEGPAPRGYTPPAVLGWGVAAPPKGQKKGPVNVALQTPIDQLQEGDAVKFDAPRSPNTAFIMADGGGDNAPGELAFGGFVVKNSGKVNVFAINCSHLGCSVALNKDARTFHCPCHGSPVHLDGTLLQGPAPAPLSHLTWKQGPNPSAIAVDGIVLGF